MPSSTLEPCPHCPVSGVVRERLAGVLRGAAVVGRRVRPAGDPDHRAASRAGGLLHPDPADPLATRRQQGAYTAFTRFANLVGQPAISLPLYWTDAGLPIGVHLVAAYGREDLLINVAAQLERAKPWTDRLPPL